MKTITRVQTLCQALPDMHTLQIFCTIACYQSPRFTEIQKILGLNTRGLTERLRFLTKAGYILRTRHKTAPPKVEYRLTDRGLALNRALQPLLRWASRSPTARSSD